MGITVCYKCEKRELGCHAHCQDYIKAKEENDAEREFIRISKAESYNQKIDIFNGIKRMKHGRKRKVDR